MNRVLVLGNCGSGKTTFARRLAGDLGCEHVELDSIFHQPNWQPLDREVFADIVAGRVAGDRWVIEGGYSQVRSIIVARADTIVWLDLPYLVIALRLWQRTLSRVFRGEELWNGNRERLGNILFTWDGIVWWQMRKHLVRKREFAALFGAPAVSGIEKIHLKSAREVEGWWRGRA